MRLPLLFASLFSVLFTLVEADYTSSYYEVLFFYYAYKIQRSSGVERTMGGKCQEKEEICNFAEFIQEIMSPEFLKHFTPDSEPAYRTHHPHRADSETFKRAFHDAEDESDYRAAYVGTTVDSKRFTDKLWSETKLQDLIEQATKNISTADTNGGTSIDPYDVLAARAAVFDALRIRETNPTHARRTGKIFRNTRKSISHYAIAKKYVNVMGVIDAQGLTDVEGGTEDPDAIDWVKSRQNVRALMEDGTLTSHEEIKENTKKGKNVGDDTRDNGDMILNTFKRFHKSLETEQPDNFGLGREAMKRTAAHQLVIAALEKSMSPLDEIIKRLRPLRIRDGPPTNPQADAGNDAGNNPGDVKISD